MILSSGPLGAAEQPLKQEWDYAPAMREIAQRFRGKEGVVLHVGDSITYSNPYGQWARAGKGQSEDDKAVLKWMHTGSDDTLDGWFLCRFDHPDGGRSHTAAGGLRLNELLAGGKQGLPSLAEMLSTYQPQIVILMLGTNDASASRPADEYRRDATQAVDLILKADAICVLSTIPPHPGQLERSRAYNIALRDLARERKLPLIDYEREILSRRPDDWNGTLLGKDDVHPTAGEGDISATSEPTAENLRASGYLLRGWLSVQKVAEIKRTVIDRLPGKADPAEPFSGRPSQRPRQPFPAPDGRPMRVAVTRDTWLSAVDREGNGNNGGSAQMKLKSIQEMSLIDFDPAPLRGHTIAGALVHVRKRGTEVLQRVTVSSFAAPWVEGTETNYGLQKGSSTFNSRQHPDVPWAFRGSDLTAVILGQGGTIWSSADASEPDADDWQQIPVEPSVIAARVAGVSEGCLLFDDTGTEWERNGEEFISRHFPNRVFSSREQGPQHAPYLTVFIGPADAAPPAVPDEWEVNTADLAAGEARISWLTPADQGPAGTIGFFVTAAGRPVPRYLIPAAGKPGERVWMHLRDLNLERGATLLVKVQAVDEAGNVGPAAEKDVKLSAEKIEPLPGRAPQPFSKEAPLPRLGRAEVAVVDPLDKLLPASGGLIPPQPPGYFAANHLWSAAENRIQLHAGRNEFVAFQIAFRGPVQNVQARLEFPGAGPPPTASFFRFRHVASDIGPVPDPVLPLGAGWSVPATDEQVANQKCGSLLCEIYVPHEAAAGQWQAELTLQSGAARLRVPVTLTVWDFTLPDYLSFLPELNCYSLPDNEGDYYRLAHRHRTILNRVPYSQRGEIDAGCAPIWDGSKLDWTAWDKRFAGYLAGSAFADLPRAGVPLECFYLPLHENWPTPVEGNYNGHYWADRAFPDSYRQAFSETTRQFAAHFHERGWHDTMFHGYFNNKVNYKSNGWSRASSPWLLDEPANFQDYWALKYFGEAFHAGANAAGGEARMLYRCDISRPEWQRQTLDEVLDYNVVAGGAFQKYRRFVLDRKRDFKQVVMVYGSTNSPAASNLQPVAWCVDTWTREADGVLPWQSVGNAGSWTTADPLALFYPGAQVGQKEPVPSIRLKAYLRGQQDAEYLTLLAKVAGESQRLTGRRVRGVLALAGTRRGTGFTADEDAGVMDYGQLKPQDLWSLRVRAGTLISAARPPANRKYRNDFGPPTTSGDSCRAP